MQSAPKCLWPIEHRAAPLPLQLRPDPTVALAAAARRRPPVAHIVRLGSVQGATVAGKGVGSRCPFQPPVQLVAPAASPGIGLPRAKPPRFQRTNGHPGGLPASIAHFREHRQAEKN